MIDDKMAKVDWTLNWFIKSPHILIAGAAGSGKSVLMNAMLYSLLKPESYWFDAPENMPRLTLIDTKRVELRQYADWGGMESWDYDMTNILGDLAYVDTKIDERYIRMEARGLKETDEPHWYVVIDELANVVYDKNILEYLIKIGRLGKPVHIHLLCCTQDPLHSLDSRLMQHFTCKMALKCRNKDESIQSIGREGAERIDHFGYGLIDIEGQRGYFEFERVPEEDIENLVQSTKDAINWSKWMQSKPTFKERILGTRKKYAGFLNQCYDPDYIEKLGTSHAKL